MDNYINDYSKIQPFLTEISQEDQKIIIQKDGSIKVRDLFNVVSNNHFLVERPDLCIKAIELIPNHCESERIHLIKTIQAVGLANLSKENIQLAIREASLQPDIDLLKLLLPYSKFPHVVDNAGTTFLHLMAQSSNTKQINQILSIFNDADYLIHKTKNDGSTPLHAAAFARKLDVLELLVGLGADINAQNNVGNTALINAVLREHQDVIEWAMDHGANINTSNKAGLSALHFAASLGNVHLVRLLVDLGANTSAITNQQNSVLMNAVMNNKLGVVQWLVSNGAMKSINRQNEEGRTPLHVAASKGNLEIVKLLAGLGADLEIKNNHGNTPLTLAIIFKKYDVVDYLIKLGADINTVNNDGMTPLHQAGLNGEPVLFANLMESNGRLEVLDCNENTPLFLLISKVSINEDLESIITQEKGLTTEIIDRKLLAHRFSIEGRSTIDGVGVFDLQGFNVDIVVPRLSVGIKVYYSQLISGLKSKNNPIWDNMITTLTAATQKQVQTLETDKMIQILESTAEAISKSTSLTPSEAAAQHAEGNSVGLASGWPLHTLGIALHKNRLAICNRGEESGGTPGIHLYEITNTAKLEGCLKNCIPKSTKSYLATSIKEELGLVELNYLKQKEQSVGNCSLVNIQSMELALFYMQLEPLIGSSAAEELARAIKRGRTQDTRAGSVEDYLKTHDTPRFYPPDLDLIKQIYFKETSDRVSDSQIKKIIKRWADDHQLDLAPVVPKHIKKLKRKIGLPYPEQSKRKKLN